MATSLCFAASPPLQLRPPGFTSNSMTPSHPLRIAFPPSRHARRPPTATLSALQGLIDPSVLSSSVSAISKLMTTLLVGVAAAKRGLLDTATLTALSKCVFNIFLPCLMLTNVVRTMSVPFSSGLFYLPMAAVATVFIGLMLGIVGAKLLRLTDPERRVFLVCCGFGNSAALPLLFANALFAGQPGNLAALVSSISFFLIGWTGFFWSVGYSILAGLPDPSAAPAVAAGQNKALGGLLRAAGKRVVSPPLIGAFAGLSIGLSPVCTSFLASPMFSALQTLGSGYSPAAVLILAGSLARKVETPTSSAPGEVSSLQLRMPRLVIAISICRFIILPLLAILVIPRVSVFNTPFIKLAVLLEAIMPPAQNSTLILNLEKKPDAAASMARILLVVYLVGAIPMSIGLTYFLGFAGV